MKTSRTKIAIVTGAAQGLGLEAAQQLAKLGHSVILADTNEAKAIKAASKMLKMGLDATGKHLDVTKVIQVRRLRDFADKGLQVMVSNT